MEEGRGRGRRGGCGRGSEHGCRRGGGARGRQGRGGGGRESGDNSGSEVGSSEHESAREGDGDKDDAMASGEEDHSPSSSGEIVPEATVSDDSSFNPSVTVSDRPSRRRRMPSRFRVDDEDSDNDGMLCVLCNSNEPATLASQTVVWVDCSECGCWVHNVCAFGKNTVTRLYLCENCSDK